MLRPGLVSITFRQHEPETIVRAVREAGLGGIEWGGDVHVPHGDLRAAARVRAATEAEGLATVAYGSYYKFGETRDDGGPSFEAVLDTAEALGAAVVRIWAGSTASASTPDLERARIVELARDHGEAALARGIRLAFEFHRNTLTDTAESTTSLLGEIGHSAVGSLWQPPHGCTAEECLVGLRSVASHLEHVHCFHWGPEGGSDRRPLAQGEERWLRYLTELDRMTPGGQTRWVLMEFVPSGEFDDFRRDAAVLRGWIDRVTDARDS